MNVKEELGKEILEVLKKSKAGVSKGIEIAVKECPEILKEIVALLRFEAAIPVLCHAVMTIICFVIFSKLPFDLENILLMIGNFGSAILGLLFLVLAMTSLFDCIKPFVAPRLTVIDYVSKWIQK